MKSHVLERWGADPTEPLSAVRNLQVALLSAEQLGIRKEDIPVLLSLPLQEINLPGEGQQEQWELIQRRVSELKRAWESLEDPNDRVSAQELLAELKVLRDSKEIFSDLKKEIDNARALGISLTVIENFFRMGVRRSDSEIPPEDLFSVQCLSRVAKLSSELLYRNRIFNPSIRDRMRFIELFLQSADPS